MAVCERKMTSHQPQTNFYVIGGTLRGDALSYVQRRADLELYSGLIEGRFCYVLTSRQMGKSSLMVRTAARLRESGIAVAVLDLTAIGQNLTAEQWYFGLVSRIGQQLDLEDSLESFWLAHSRIAPLQRMIRAIREVVMVRHDGRVIIFVDEIDAVRSLPFSTDEFFAAVREVHNRRSEDAELVRLNFCLLGVATPSDLVRDTRTTPFNIGQRVELNDFAEDEAAPLAKGLGRSMPAGEILLKRILHWTGGHPYLTQSLCHAIAQDPTLSSPADVDRVCEDLFLSTRSRERDDNLLFVRERLLRSEADLASLLDLYSRVRRHQHVRDDDTNPLISILRLSGIARISNGDLRVRNLIYYRVFDQQWVSSNMPDAELRRQRVAYRRGVVRAATVAAIILSIIAILAVVAVRQRNRALAQESSNRRLLYAAQVNLAQQAWDAANIRRMKELLEDQVPREGREDLRGFEWYYLWQLCHHDLFTLRHAGPVNSVAFSATGKVVATASNDGTVKIWDVSTTEELATLRVSEGWVTSIAFSPDSKMLASGSNDRSVKLWDTATKQELASFTGHTGQVNSVAFSPDGNRVASGAGDHDVGETKIWDVAGRREIATLKGEEGAINSVAFSPDGKLLATGNWLNTVKLWEVATGKERATLKGHGVWVSSVTFSPDGKKLASGSFDSTAKLWDVATGRELATLRSQSGVIHTVAFSPDGKWLATGGTDSSVKLWDVATAQELTTHKGHSDIIYSVAFSPDGKTVATASKDGTAKLWDTATQVAAETEWSTLKGHEGPVSFVAFSPDGTLVASAGGDDRTVRLWDLGTGRQLAALVGHSDQVNSLAFSPDGKTLASASGDHTAKLWDVVTRQERAALTGHGDLVWSIAFSPDGKIIATGSWDKTAKIWDVATASEVATLDGFSDAVDSLAFAPDGSILATGSGGRESGIVRFWDVATRREIGMIEGHQGSVSSISYSPDGKTLATGSWDSSIRTWDSTTHTLLTTLKGHTGRIRSVAFSPDGKRLASGGDDAKVKLWDTMSGQELATLRGHNGIVWSLTFSRSGGTLATASQDSTVKLWLAGER